MGGLFKVMTLAQPSLGTLPGFPIPSFRGSPTARTRNDGQPSQPNDTPC
jgi:hypothetical protein